MQHPQFMKAGHNDIASMHCQNAVRKRNEQKNLLKLSSQVGSMASRVQSAMMMRQVTANMSNTVRSMDSLMKSMNLEKMTAIMDQFESQNQDMDVLANHYDTVTTSATATTVPQDEVNSMMKQLADQAGIEIAGELASVPDTPLAQPAAVNLDSRLQRLRAE